MCPGLDEIKPSTKKQENTTMAMAAMAMVVVIVVVVAKRGGGKEGKLSLALRGGNLRLQGYRAVRPSRGFAFPFPRRCI